MQRGVTLPLLAMFTDIEISLEADGASGVDIAGTGRLFD